MKPRSGHFLANEAGGRSVMLADAHMLEWSLSAHNQSIFLDDSVGGMTD